MRSFSFLLLIFVLALVMAHARGEDACRGTVNGKKYDLSKLAAALNNGVATASDPWGQMYTYKVCGDLGSMCAWAQDPAPAICQKDARGNQFDVGSATGVSWRALSSGAEGFILTFGGGVDNRQAIIEFTCDAQAGTGVLKFDGENPMHSYNFKWATAHACPTAGGGGKECCLYSGPSSCGSDMRALCQDSSRACPSVVGTYKLAYNWTVDSCEHCKF